MPSGGSEFNVSLFGKVRMHRLSTVLCTSGLAAEANIARAAGFPVVIGAGDRERTAALVENAAQHANCLMSFGIAGALAPHLRPGDVVISAEVVSADHRWTAAGPFQARVAALAQEIGAFEARCSGRARSLQQRTQKAALGATQAPLPSISKAISSPASPRRPAFPLSSRERLPIASSGNFRRPP